MEFRRPREGRLRLPSAEIYVTWGFPAPVERMEWDLRVHRDPGSDVGQYLALYSGAIDGSACYLGIQTDVYDPRVGHGVGKGLIFSTWWTDELDHCRCAPDGFAELGAHEGGFVGVRRCYPWTTGSYRVVLSRSATEWLGRRPMDWFSLSIAPLGSRPSSPSRETVGRSEVVGAIRFPRRVADRPARIEPGMAFLEVYSGVQSWSAVPSLAVDVMAYGDGIRCPEGSTEYPRPYGMDVPIADVWYVEERSTLRLQLASGQKGRHAPTRWP